MILPLNYRDNGWIIVPGNGIEPLSKDFQSNALPLSYPVDIKI